MQKEEIRFQIKAYPMFAKIIIGYAAEHGIGRSTAARNILHSFINGQTGISEEQKKKYLSIYNKLSDEERLHPPRYQNRI